MENCEGKKEFYDNKKLDQNSMQMFQLIIELLEKMQLRIACSLRIIHNFSPNEQFSHITSKRKECYHININIFYLYVLTCTNSSIFCC